MIEKRYHANKKDAIDFAEEQLIRIKAYQDLNAYYFISGETFDSEYGCIAILYKDNNVIYHLWPIGPRF